jgi:hypothetical protein
VGQQSSNKVMMSYDKATMKQQGNEAMRAMKQCNNDEVKRQRQNNEAMMRRGGSDKVTK